MVHFFVIDYGDTGDFYNIGIDGATKEEAEKYLQKQSCNVRFLKSVESRKYKNYKDIGIGKLFYCKYLPHVPKGLSPDSREVLYEKR